MSSAGFDIGIQKMPLAGRIADGIVDDAGLHGAHIACASVRSLHPSLLARAVGRYDKDMAISVIALHHCGRLRGSRSLTSRDRSSFPNTPVYRACCSAAGIKTELDRGSAQSGISDIRARLPTLAMISAVSDRRSGSDGFQFVQAIRSAARRRDRGDAPWSARPS